MTSSFCLVSPQSSVLEMFLRKMPLALRPASRLPSASAASTTASTAPPAPLQVVTASFTRASISSASPIVDLRQTMICSDALKAAHHFRQQHDLAVALVGSRIGIQALQERATPTTRGSLMSEPGKRSSGDTFLPARAEPRGTEPMENLIVSPGKKSNPPVPSSSVPGYSPRGWGSRS